MAPELLILAHRQISRPRFAGILVIQLARCMRGRICTGEQRFEFVLIVEWRIHVFRNLKTFRARGGAPVRESLFYVWHFEDSKR